MTLAQTAGLMMVASGLAHAVVNAILKSGRDKMSSRALIDGFSALLISPLVLFLPPPRGAWVWLGASWVTHLIYLVALIRAFEGADMMVAYPIFRGIAPALAATVAVAVFRETISWPVAIGVGLVSAGVLATAMGRHMSRRSLAWSILTGCTIALYTVIDAQGVRAAPSAPSYIAWLFLSLGGGVGLIFALWRGPAFVLSARAEWKAALPRALSRSSPTVWRYGPYGWGRRRAWRPCARSRSCSVSRSPSFSSRNAPASRA